VILPQILDTARTILSGLHTPPIDILGAQLGPLNVCVQQNYIIVLACLAGSGMADIPTGMTWPTSRLFGLISQNMRQAIANGAASTYSYSFSRGGTKGTKLADVHYDVSVTVNNLSASVTGWDSYHFSAVVSGQVNAYVKVVVNFGFGFNLNAEPNPSGDLQILVSGSTVYAQVSNLSPVVILLTPTGDPVQWILSAIFTPLLDAVSAVVSPIVTSSLHAFGFQIWQVQPIPLVVDGVTVNITPSGLQSQPYSGGYLMIGGDLTVSAGS
jgi:hypothetical protein